MLWYGYLVVEPLVHASCASPLASRMRLSVMSAVEMSTSPGEYVLKSKLVVSADPDESTETIIRTPSPEAVCSCDMPTVHSERVNMELVSFGEVIEHDVGVTVEACQGICARSCVHSRGWECLELYTQRCERVRGWALLLCRATFALLWLESDVTLTTVGV